jgi:hypothetical protein
MKCICDILEPLLLKFLKERPQASKWTLAIPIRGSRIQVEREGLTINLGKKEE